MQDSTLHELEMIHVKTLPTHATFSHNLGLAMIRVKMFTIHGKVRMI